MINLIHYIQPIQWIAGIILLVLATYVSQFQELKLSKGLIYFFVCTSLWCFCAALMMDVTDLETKVTLNRIKMLGAVCISPTLLQIALDFNNSYKFATLLKRISLATSIFFCLVIISPWHELLITNYEIVQTFSIDLLHFKNGKLFIFHNIFSRIYILVALAFLFQSSFATNKFFKKTAWIFILSIFVPFIIDSIGVFFKPEIRYLQLVPVTLTFTSFLMVYTLLKHRSLNLMPIARSSVFNSLTEPCLVWNLDGNLIDCNDSAIRLFEIPDDFKNADRLDELKKDNTLYFINKSVFKVKYGPIINNEKEAGTYSILQNITESYNNDIVKTNLMSVLSHDIQGHVGQLGFLSETLYFDQKSLKEEELKKLTECVYLTTQDVNYFLGDIVHWSRDQYSGWKIKKENFELRSLVLSICQYVNSLAKMKEITIHNQIETNMIIQSDSAMLEIVLRNLIYNSIKHSPLNSEVIMRYENNCFVIINEGELNNTEELNRYFSENQYSSLGTGSEGLGHRICKEFISHLGYTIHYQNTEDKVKVVLNFDNEL